MLRIDAHHHLWKYDPVRKSWITDEMAAIKKDFLPQDFQPVLRKYHFDGSVAVQTTQSEIENDFLLDAAADHDFIKGIVGWVDLQAENVGERLSFYNSFKKIKGFRPRVAKGGGERFAYEPTVHDGHQKPNKFRINSMG